MTDDWDGGERRATDKRFAAAMADVRALKGGVADLAEAVKVKSDDLTRVLARMAALLAALFVALSLASFVWVAMLNRHMDDGHRRIICTINLTAEQKAALGDLACK